MRIRMQSTKRGAEDGYTLKDYLAGVEYDLSRTPGARDLAAVFVREGWAVKVESTASSDVRPVYRLPLESEYRRAGYTGDYAAFLSRETAGATARGERVEVRDCTAAELEAIEIERKRIAASEPAPTPPPAAVVAPAGVADLAAVLNVPAEIPPTLSAESAPTAPPPPLAVPAARPQSSSSRGSKKNRG